MKIIVYHKGGFGNQLYQFALAKYLSSYYDAELICDITYFKVDIFVGNTHRNFELNKIFSNLNVRSSFYTLIFNFLALKYLRNNRSFFYLTDNNFKSNMNLFEFKKVKYLILNGYFQNNNNILKQIDHFIYSKINIFNSNYIIDHKTSLCIHIRKGDYLKYENIYTNLTPSYYFNGIRYLNNKYKINHVIYIFTDNINWVKLNILNNKLYNYKIISTNSTIEDFRLLSTFKKVIISNSTFSLWSTYLTLKDKIDVIAPQKWYVDYSKNIDFIDNNLPKSFILLN